MIIRTSIALLTGCLLAILLNANELQADRTGERADNGDARLLATLDEDVKDVATLDKGESAESRLIRSIGQLPMRFEENQGQTDAPVRYLSQGPGYGLVLLPNEAVLALNKKSSTSSRPDTTNDPAKSNLVRMRLVNANASPKLSGRDQLFARSHYYVGNDPEKWHTGIANYQKVHYEDVYAGIDLVYYGNQEKLEYDFVVAPGADPEAIQLEFQGVQNLHIDESDRLILNIDDGHLV